MPMGYEVEGNILELYAQHLLSNPLDSTEGRFGTYEEKDMQVHEQLKKPMLVQRVRKEVEAFADSMDISAKARRKREQDEDEKEPTRTEFASPTTSSTRTRSTRNSEPLSGLAKKSSHVKAQVKASSKRKKDKSTRVYAVVSEDEETKSDEEVREIKNMGNQATKFSKDKPSGEAEKAKKKMKTDKPGMFVDK